MEGREDQTGTGSTRPRTVPSKERLGWTSSDNSFIFYLSESRELSVLSVESAREHGLGCLNTIAIKY